MRRLLLLVAVLAGAGVLTLPAAASHSWGSYHWARTANPFTLRVLDGNSSSWDSQLDIAITDWDRSSVLSLLEEAANPDRKCRAVTGKIKSCNGAYGQNGWLGLATIRASGSHITSGTAKMNDTYFTTAAYNNPVKKQHVMCQEIGHDFGLDHQDESGADLNTCMDYSNALDNPSPNQHDYQQLETIYAHLDTTSTIAGTLADQATAKPERVERIGSDRGGLTWNAVLEETAPADNQIQVGAHMARSCSCPQLTRPGQQRNRGYTCERP